MVDALRYLSETCTVLAKTALKQNLCRKNRKTERRNTVYQIQCRPKH